MRDYIELTKPRITWLILMSTGIGYFFGLPSAAHWWEFLRGIRYLSLLHTILGTGLIASGTAALNQWYEREADGRMRRTSGRPLPSGRISADGALAFGTALSILGFLELWLGVNLLTGSIGAFTLIELSVPLHALETAHLVVHDHRGHPRRHASADRVRGRRRHAHARGLAPWPRSCSSGNSRTSTPSPGCTKRTTRGPASGCCR